MSELNELLERYIRDGNVAAMDEIVAKTRGRLLGTARRIGDPQDAEDSVQATYYALLRRGSKPLEAPLIAWLLTVTVRIAYRRKAARRREVVLADQLSIPSDDAGPHQSAARAERNTRLREEVTRLPTKYRDVIVLRYLEGLSSKECARLLDCTDTAVRTRLKRARELLRGRLHPRVAHGLAIVPWWFTDQAQAVSLMGVTMKIKVAAAVTLLAVMGLLFVARGVFRSEADGASARAGRAESGSKRIGTVPDTESEDAAARRERSPQGRALPDPVDLAAVDRDRDIHGTVVRRGGGPIAGARIRVVEFPWQRGSTLNMARRWEAVPGPDATTARDGTFAVRWSKGRMGWLEVSADGLAARRIPYVQAGERLRIALDEGARIRITAKDSNGQLVEGVAVRLFPTMRSMMMSREYLATTDAEGRCTLDGVIGPGKAHIDASHPLKGGPSWIAVDVPASGETRDVEIALPPSRTLQGRVTDKATGRPVEGALIGKGWTQESAVRSDDNGRYELPGWSGKGASEIAISHPDYGRDRARVGDRETVDFELEPGDRVAGRVVDSRGVPVAGARLTAIGSVRRPDGQMVSRAYGVSGPDGRFDVGGLRHDMPHALVAMKRGYGRYLLDLAPSARAGGRIDTGDVTLPKARSIVGRVVDDAIQPLARASVDLKGANADRNRLAAGVRDPNSWYGERERRYTDDLGRFRFPDLAPGEYTVTVKRAGGATVQRTVRISEEQDEATIEIRVATARPLVVRVETVQGAPIPNAFVNVQFGEGENAQQKSDAEGQVKFQVSGTVHKVGINWVMQSPKGIVYALPGVAAPFEKDASEVTIVLRRGASLRGVVRKPNGKPQPRAWIAVRQNGKELPTVIADGEGKFFVSVPGGGRFDLSYKGSSDARGHAVPDRLGGELRGVASDSNQIVLRLRELSADRTLTVRVLDADGEPMPSTRVQLSLRAGGGISAETGADGRTYFEALLPRQYYTFLPDAYRHADKFIAPKLQAVVPDGQEVVLRYRHGTPLDGVVTGVRPRGGHVTIYIRNKGGQIVVQTFAAADGKFRALVPKEEGTGPFTLSAQQGREPGPRDLGVVKNVHISDEPVTIPLGNQR